MAPFQTIGFSGQRFLRKQEASCGGAGQLFVQLHLKICPVNGLKFHLGLSKKKEEVGFIVAKVKNFSVKICS
jgi:hypothetical protein